MLLVSHSALRVGALRGSILFLSSAIQGRRRIFFFATAPGSWPLICCYTIDIGWNVD